ncbi:MAG TPA: preprotein translocase subunit SecG [Thermoflexia bacterium]|jgi:preprotein translocase subunit SecG|nr:preprotein translocase subunit SecG [Thermoflexia bacterium]
MATYLNIAQIIVGVALIVVIVVQTQSSGLGGVFGGTQTSFRRKRRGVEKTLFIISIVLSVVFFIIALVNALVAESLG